MAFNKCTNCDTSMLSNETYSCESCGASMCSNCVEEVNATCPYCSAKVVR